MVEYTATYCTKCGGIISGDVSNCYCKNKQLSWREKCERADKRLAELEAEVERLKEIEDFWQTYSSLVEDGYPREHDAWMRKAREIVLEQKGEL